MKPDIIRLNDYTLQLSGEKTANLFMNKKLTLEPSALEEITNIFSLEGLNEVAFMPDCHKGTGVPIGTVANIDRVYPAIPGNDLGCGMRLDVTELNISDLTVTETLREKLRHAFFEGGREIIVLSKEDMLAYGLEASSVLFGSTITPYKKIKNNSHQNGVLGNGEVSFLFMDYISRNGRDNFLGSIGGGNHFVELQYVDEIINKNLAYKYGLHKNAICIMCHSGSLDLGHVVGNFYKDLAKKLWQGKYPEHGFFSLPQAKGEEYIKASYNAANFATVNRFIMSAMVAGILNTNITSIYDAPHNLIWAEDFYLHRKGACPANHDELVIIPGSMGTRSALALGCGAEKSLNSAPHGAGRVLNRNAARKDFNLQNIDVISKIDPKKVRSDIANEILKTLNEEAPRVYKDVEQVVDTVEGNNIAKTIAWLKPILTIKG